MLHIRSDAPRRRPVQKNERTVVQVLRNVALAAPSSEHHPRQATGTSLGDRLLVVENKGRRR
eukprot:8684152-Pyramimonas_sp.AAC.1